jgi:hypothetical protein
MQNTFKSYLWAKYRERPERLIPLSTTGQNSDRSVLECWSVLSQILAGEN